MGLSPRVTSRTASLNSTSTTMTSVAAYQVWGASGASLAQESAIIGRSSTVSPTRTDNSGEEATAIPFTVATGWACACAGRDGPAANAAMTDKATMSASASQTQAARPPVAV